jgi:AraC-like DNA-binding protein
MDARIRWAMVELERRLQEPVSIAGLARATNLSPSRFTHLFRANAGVSPRSYLRTLRLARARVLIERTFLTVKEVMAQVGFTDPSHFSRDFRRMHGITPRELRGRGWTGCERHPDSTGLGPDGVERRGKSGQAAAEFAKEGAARPRGNRSIVDPCTSHRRRTR